MGKGTVFTVTLPRGVRALQKSSNILAADINPNMANTANWLAEKHILVLENDDQIMNAMKTLLTGWGATVTGSQSLQQARAVCPQAPDVMLVDFHLDYGEKGTTSAVALKDFWQKDVPGILNTANREDGVRDEAAAAGLRYLPKPVKPAALKRMLKKLIVTDG